MKDLLLEERDRVRCAVQAMLLHVGVVNDLIRDYLLHSGSAETLALLDHALGSDASGSNGSELLSMDHERPKLSLKERKGALVVLVICLQAS